MRRRTTLASLLPRFLLATAGLLLGVPALAAQDEPRVAVQLGSGVVRLGEPVVLRIVVEDAPSARVSAVPQVDGLAFGPLQGPSRQVFESWVNGRRSRSQRLSWSLSIRPERAGTFEIPPIELEVGRRAMRTRALSLKVVRDLTGADLGFLEIRTTPAGRVIEGQPFSVEIRFGWDAEADVNYANLVLPWWGELFGALELSDEERPSPPNPVQGVTVNDDVQVVCEGLEESLRDGRSFRTLRLVERYIATRSGELELPVSFLEFGRLVERRAFLSARTEKVKSYYVEAPSLSLEVVPLPSEGQPFDYGGAVGTIAAKATVDSRDVRAGDSIKLTVTWTGTGNLEFFEAPEPSRIDAFGGFRYYGKTEEKSFDRRRVVYDIAPLSSETDRIPALPLSVFDPALERYVTVRTDPIPIRVRPLKDAATLGDSDEPSFARDVRDIDTRPIGAGSAERSRVPGDAAVAATAAGVPLVWILLHVLVRRRRGDPAAPLERRRRRARRALVRSLRAAGDPRDRLRAFAEFLAARTRESEAAWIGRGEGAALQEIPGVPPAAAERIAALLERLEAAVYGEPGRSVDAREILETADRLLEAGL